MLTNSCHVSCFYSSKTFYLLNHSFHWLQLLACLIGNVSWFGFAKLQGMARNLFIWLLANVCNLGGEKWWSDANPLTVFVSVLHLNFLWISLAWHPVYFKFTYGISLYQCRLASWFLSLGCRLREISIIGVQNQAMLNMWVLYFVFLLFRVVNACLCWLGLPKLHQVQHTCKQRFSGHLM
jgi:hypothetical protein